MTIDEAIWAFLPARRAKGRTTVPSVIAANIGAPVPDVMEALHRMDMRGQVVRDPRGSWHRGVQIETGGGPGHP